MSKFFEFYFNPKSRKDTLFEAFCFSPASKEEEKLGDLYLVGELKNILPKNKNLLKEIAEIIKSKYYFLPQRSQEISEQSLTPQEFLKESLTEANRFLEKELQKENTDWLGNLNFFVLSLSYDLKAYFSEIGNLKVFLLREEEIFNLGSVGFKNNTGRMFSNIVEGKLLEGDRLVILGEELFENLWQNKIFNEFKKVKKPKELKKLLKENKEFLRKLFGVLLFIFVEKERKKIYLNLSKIALFFPSFTRFFQKISHQQKKIQHSFFQKILPQSSFFQSPIFLEKIKKSFISILILILLLLLGYLIFH